MEEARFERWEERRPLPGLAAECFELHENRPGIFASSHWHNESELILVQRGCYRILAGAEGRLLAAGEAVFIPQRLRHTTICPDQPEVSLIVLKFEPSFLLAADPAEGEAELLSGAAMNGAALWLSPMETACCGLPSRLGLMLREIAAERTGWRLAVRAGICTILLELLRLAEARRQTPGPARSEAGADLGPVFDYLERHYREPVRAGDLLPLCHLSYSRFSVRFKELTGFCLTEYLNRLRISRARRLIEAGEMPLGEVAAACGFLDPCYFDRLFRRYTGMTPSRCRREYAAAKAAGKEPSA